MRTNEIEITRGFLFDSELTYFVGSASFSTFQEAVIWVRQQFGMGPCVLVEA